MKRILVSWVDFRHDFEQNNLSHINTSGLTIEYHQYCYQKRHKKPYDEHILLSWVSENNDNIDTKHEAMHKQSLLLETYLTKNFKGRQISLRFMDIKNPIDLTEILEKCRTLLKELCKRGQVDIFYNTGYQMMQLAWYICHDKYFPEHTTLIQMRKKEYDDKAQKEPTLYTIDVKLGSSLAPYYLSTRNEEQKMKPANIVITPQLQAVYDRAYLVAQSNTKNIMILGESGTGKELLAKAIYDHAKEFKASYKTLNCAAYTEELLRSELFGHEKGAFTDAKEAKKGILEECEGGTVFLDEIGDAAPHVQVNLLRFLQFGEFEHVGGNKTLKTNARVIAATNRNLSQAIANNHFRLDLFHRFPVRLHLPAFAEYPIAEKEKILNEILERISEKHHHTKLQLSKEAFDFMLRHNFEGNFREIEGLIENLYLFYVKGNKTIGVADLKKELLLIYRDTDTAKDLVRLKDVELAHIQRVLERNNGNLSQTSRDLGISLNNLKSKIKK